MKSQIAHLMIPIVIGFGLLFLVISNEPSSSVSDKVSPPVSSLKGPQVDDCPTYFCGKWFEVVQASKKLERTDLGWVVIKRMSDGALFSALLIPHRNVQTGTAVWVRQIIYRQNNMSLATFLVAYEPEPMETRPYAPQGQP